MSYYAKNVAIDTGIGVLFCLVAEISGAPPWAAIGLGVMIAAILGLGTRSTSIYVHASNHSELAPIKIRLPTIPSRDDVVVIKGRALRIRQVQMYDDSPAVAVVVETWEMTRPWLEEIGFKERKP